MNDLEVIIDRISYLWVMEYEELFCIWYNVLVNTLSVISEMVDEG